MQKLKDAIEEAKRITNFEGKRRQMQFIGKLMRGLDAATLDSVRAALDEQNRGPAQETAALHDADYAKTSIARKLASLRSFYRFGQREGWVKTNPARALRNPRKGRSLPHFLTTADIGKLLAAPPASEPMVSFDCKANVATLATVTADWSPIAPPLNAISVPLLMLVAPE